MLDSLARVYAALPAEQEYLVEYKLFEPAFYATDLADWGSALLVCQRLGERARVLVDMGHHAQGVNVEQIVSILASEDRLGGFHFNNRKYADDDLIVGSVNPFELFLVFCELVGGGRPLPRLTIDQSHNIEAKVEAMVMSVVNIQDAYARALIVDRERAARRGAQRRRARRPPGAARRLQHGRAAALRERAQGARRRRRSRGGAARVRALRAHRGRARGRGSAMSATAELIASAADLWGADGHGGATRSTQLVRASNLLGADRAVSNFGGGNTSAKGSGGRPHGRRALRDVGQGLGQRSRHDRAAAASPRCACRRCCR